MYNGFRFPNLTVSEVRAASKSLKSVGLKLPKCGWTVDMPDGKRTLVHDPKGYFFLYR